MTVYFEATDIHFGIEKQEGLHHSVANGVTMGRRIVFEYYHATQLYSLAQHGSVALCLSALSYIGEQFEVEKTFQLRLYVLRKIIGVGQSVEQPINKHGFFFGEGDVLVQAFEERRVAIEPITCVCLNKFEPACA